MLSRYHQLHPALTYDELLNTPREWVYFEIQVNVLDAEAAKLKQKDNE